MRPIIQYFLPISLVLSPFIVSAQDAVLSGTIRDANTGKPLKGQLFPASMTA
ncbi:hypothetical protein KUH03_17300 [Sphingobacterium sp. E70]|uniref:hypothetical protein n=1 Tax=Sphingobacterium sp. E70 TaxID=2853439 RepID=UPI00211D0608|nr:hypothetical protein [Sphingobacterium sp. E70]ULT28191.1 hypothetical protein KUH03_17300 [Sphingobacterium sp. E70]